MALKRWLLLLMLILASLLTAISCAANPVIPAPNYSPSKAIKEKLQEAAKAFGRDLPIPTYLPQGYSISNAEFRQRQYSYDKVELNFASPSAPDISMSITWFGGVFRLLPTADRYKYIDISGGSGRYSKALLNYRDVENTLWWDWTPILNENEPPPTVYYEMVLSASKDVPDEELVNIAKFVRLP